MTNSDVGTLYPVLFGIVIALASILVVTTWLQSDMTLSYGGGSNVGSGSFFFGNGGNGGAGGLADIDIAEAEDAGNATIAGAANQNTTNGNTAEFLSIQTAHSGSISQVNETVYTLELNNVSDSTIMFSDRPGRVIETVSTADFVGNWTTGTNSFSSDEPNDALIVENIQTGNLETYVIESSSPVYDTNTDTLTYTIMTDDATSIDLLSEFGQAVLVIDPGGQSGPGTGT
jgi:hypothetical protein